MAGLKGRVVGVGIDAKLPPGNTRTRENIVAANLGCALNDIHQILLGGDLTGGNFGCGPRLVKRRVLVKGLGKPRSGGQLGGQFVKIQMSRLSH